MCNHFYISNRLISENSPPLVIAELGINHGGSLNVAKKIVDAAKESNAEIIKHQTHIPKKEMSPLAKKIIPGNANEPIYDVIKNNSLTENEELELKRYVESKGMIFISTPFSKDAVDRLEKFDVPAYKIGSGECNNYPLIKYIASLKKPVILSTGMNDLDSIEKAVNIFREENVPFALLHCTNVYPTPSELVRLGALQELKGKFPDAIIGLSDHTTSNYACFGAVALGASILERHFTDSKNRNGPDIICSMDPSDLGNLIEGSEEIAKCRGGKKFPVEKEKDCMDFAFATVVTTKTINQGEKFTKDNIWVKRPGSGEIKAEEYEEIIGKKANKDLKCDYHLKQEDIIFN